jgi:hypothetical protein
MYFPLSDYNDLAPIITPIKNIARGEIKVERGQGLKSR